MKRAIILVMDSLGIGASADAHLYGDEKANTLGHIAQACAQGTANNKQRKGHLKIPNLTRLGLAAALNRSNSGILWATASIGFFKTKSKKLLMVSRRKP